MTGEPKILSVPPPSPTNSAAGAVPPVAVPPSSPPAPAADPSPGPDVAKLQAELVRDRFDAAAARAGIAEDYVDVALALFQQTGKDATRENLAAFCAELKKSKPVLFGPQPAQTAPVPSQAVPAAPAPGGVPNHFQQWQALEASGQRAAAEAYYRLNRYFINRQG